MNIVELGQRLPHTLVNLHLKQPGSHSWHSWYAIRMNPELTAVYEYLAGVPVHKKSELSIHVTRGITWA